MPNLKCLRRPAAFAGFPSRARRLRAPSRVFRSAAKRLYLTPSAVSLRMRNLEATLGVTLFVRHGPRSSRDRCRICCLRRKSTRQMATIQNRRVDQCRRTKRQAVARDVRADVRVALAYAATSEAYYAMPDSQPIALDATDALRTPDQFDVAIRGGNGRWRGFSAVELLPDEGTPMLSPALIDKAFPITPERLLELPLIPDTRWAKWFALAGLPDAVPNSYASTQFATYELEAIAARKGVGVALLSPFLYGDLVSDGALVAPFETIVEGPASYFALWRARRADAAFRARGCARNSTKRAPLRIRSAKIRRRPRCIRP